MLFRMGAVIVCSLLVVQFINITQLQIATGEFDYWGMGPAINKILYTENSFEEPFYSLEIQLNEAKIENQIVNLELEKVKSELKNITSKNLIEKETLHSETHVNTNSEGNTVVDIFEKITFPSVVDIYSQKTDLKTCSQDEFESIESWLYFLLIYKETKPLLSELSHADLIKKTILNASILSDFTPSQLSYLKVLIDDLLSYYSKIINVKEWDEILGLAPQKGGYLNKEIMNYIYSRGFPETEKECFKRNLDLGVKSISNDHGGYFSMPYETWLYTFWLRRINEDLFFETEMALKVLNYILRDISGETRSKVFYWPSSDDNKIVEGSFLKEVYDKYLIARRDQEGMSIWLDEEFLKLEEMELYGASALRGKYKFSSKFEVVLMDEMLKSHQYKSNSNINTHGRIQFLSASKENKVNSLFSAMDFVDDNEKIKVINYFEKHHNLKWEMRYHDGKLISCDHDPTVKKFNNENKIIFIITKYCNWGSSDGIQGPSITAVISKQPGSTFNIDFNHFQTSGRLEINDYFIADEDDDGNIEVILNDVGGLNSNEILAELNQSSWSIIRSISTYSEGGYERFHERAPNRVFLNSL